MILLIPTIPGGVRNGLDRDIVNEHKDRKAKDVSKGLHSQL